MPKHYAIEWEIPANVPLESLILIGHSTRATLLVPPTEEEQIAELIDNALNKAGLIKVVSDDD